MRGKPPQPEVVTRSQRITPAHAGKTFRPLYKPERYPDHPRTCGENFFNHEPVCFRSGSPPHMRGKRLLHFKSSSAYRITPAHAGKTPVPVSAPLLPADHPRTCGENLSQLKKPGQGSGSPPHMRGKLLCLLHRQHRPRITPAHAGKTQCHRMLQFQQPDHPRTCGENFCLFICRHATPGSPPHMRGKLEGQNLTQEEGRITPAHAGKTFLF